MNRLLLTALLLVSGCGTLAPTGNDLWRGLKAERTDAEFFTGKYIGNQKHCFPPPSNRECLPQKQGEVIYQTTSHIEMEEFWLTYTARDFFAPVNGMLFLAAAEITLQRGFSMFTVIGETYSTNCRSHGYEASTSANISQFGNQSLVSGTTTVREVESCLSSKGLNILLFNDKSILGEGVLKRSVNEQDRWLVPVNSLYFGTIPNLRAQDFVRNVEGFGRVSTPKDAWKVHYDAAGLVIDLRNKYNITGTGHILYQDKMAEILRSSSSDPITRNRKVSP